MKVLRVLNYELILYDKMSYRLILYDKMNYRLILYDKQGTPDHRNLMTKDWKKDVGISFLKKTYEDKQYVIFETTLEKFMVD